MTLTDASKSLISSPRSFNSLLRLIKKINGTWRTLYTANIGGINSVAVTHTYPREVELAPFSSVRPHREIW